MKKQILIFFLNVLLSAGVTAQVFISKSIEGIILVGPNNVRGDVLMVAEYYLDEIKAFQEELMEEKAGTTGSIEALSGKEKLTKADYKNLAALRKRLEQVTQDLALSEQLYGIWRQKVLFRDSLQRVIDQIKVGNCLELTTTEGRYRSDDITIDITDSKDIIACTEFIQLTCTPDTIKLIKKKPDANCLSANPEDCMVLCLVEVPAQCTFIDMEQVEQNSNNGCADFVSNESKDVYTRKKQFNQAHKSLKSITSRRKSDQQQVHVRSWVKIKC
jgi:hypothetical protein